MPKKKVVIHQFSLNVGKIKVYEEWLCHHVIVYNEVVQDDIKKKIEKLHAMNKKLKKVRK